MRSIVMTAIATVGMATMGLPAYAQSSNTSGQDQSTSTDQASGQASGQRNADEITCRELTAMDTKTVPGVLYYISGYRAGQQNGSMGSNSASGTSGTSNANGTSSSGTAAGNAATDNSSSSGTSASGSTDTSKNNAASGSTSGSTGDNANSASSTTASKSATSGKSGSGATAQISSIRGYFDVPVQRVMVACGKAPDNTVSQTLDTERNNAGSSSTGASSTDNSSTDNSSAGKTGTKTNKSK